MNIDDDADPETLEAWYRRTPDEIAAAKQAKWNSAWAALRTPDHLAYEPEAPAPTGERVDAAARAGPARAGSPEKTAWANRELGLLDVLASGETNQGDGGYDALASGPGGQQRRIPAGADGKPNYTKFPNQPLQYVNDKGQRVFNSSAGRYQFKAQSWNDVVKAHPDVTDFTPLNQNKAAWYLASRDYSRRTGGRDLSTDLTDERYWPQIASKLSPTWSSLPGGAGQQMTQEQFNQRLRAAIGRYGAVPPDN